MSLCLLVPISPVSISPYIYKSKQGNSTKAIAARELGRGDRREISLVQGGRNNKRAPSYGRERGSKGILNFEF
ncbi:MAG: hypothetical protein F6J93_27580 [Oscillatoria sp. SIO1A7]|nr:hypothetical protein [Oscillatoria sp. SIO1A7]